MYRVIIDDPPPDDELRFPPRCPHCGGVTTTTRTFVTWRHHEAPSFFEESRPATATIVVPTCRRVPREVPAFFLQLFCTFVSVVGFFALLATPYAAIIMLVGLLAALAVRRSRTWIALPTQQGDALVLEARDAAYAHGLARLNHGRVEGRGPVPELPPGDEHRAPLPEARVKK